MGRKLVKSLKYTFIESLVKQGNRYFIQIPFNVWQECGQRGLVPVKVYIQDYIFECKLVPKGKGMYYIPVKKEIINKLYITNKINVSFEIITGLSRINHNSPYTKNNPIRKIDSIKSVTYSKAGYCGQICIAMLTGLEVDEIINIMQAKAWQCSFSKILETLDYFGISYDKIIYTRGKQVVLPTCCIVNVKDKKIHHFSLYYKGKYYDSINFDKDKIISFVAIHVT